MLTKITPKTRGNRVNVRKAMSGKGNEVIIDTLEDGAIVEGTLSKDGAWYKVEQGYVMASLCAKVPTSKKKTTPRKK